MSTDVFSVILLAAVFNAGWNLTVRKYRDKPGFVWGIGLWSGIWPIVFIPFTYTQIQWEWTTLACGLGSGFFLAVYYYYLEKAYRTGDVSVVYPIIRSSPLWVTVIGVLFMGVTMSFIAWGGLTLTVVGVSVLSLAQMRKQQLVPAGVIRDAGHQWAVIFAFASSMGTCFYTLSDKIAMDLVSIGPLAGVALTSISSTSKLLFWHLFSPSVHSGFEWRRLAPKGVPVWFMATCGLFVFASYSIVVSALQFADAGRVMAVANISIVLGAIGGVIIFKERSGLKYRLLGLVLTVGGITLLRLF